MEEALVPAQPPEQKVRRKGTKGQAWKGRRDLANLLWGTVEGARLGPGLWVPSLTSIIEPEESLVLLSACLRGPRGRCSHWA